MGIRDLIKKKDDLSETASSTDARQDAVRGANNPEFRLIRTDTHTHEEVTDDFDPTPPPPKSPHRLGASNGRSPRRSLDIFRSSRSRSDSASSGMSSGSVPRRRLSERLHLRREPESSEFVPENLPSIPADKESVESQWEARATLLASQSELARSTPSSPARPRSPSASSKAIDQDIQQAIALHEAGDLETSTAIFGKLANPRGANNPLSQVMYGLALRHGWGCKADTELAVEYLSKAAANSGAIEEIALKAGSKKGGAAKGELVLATFELANCFRHGWGIKKDPYAAKHYYETAANLGDRDAMNEAAWCYETGFGCKVDMHSAARYYRLAEQNGGKILGNSWIWKKKYDPPSEDGKSGEKGK